MSILLQMVSLASRIRPRPRSIHSEDRVIYVDPEQNPAHGNNMSLIKEIHDFYMAAHNFTEEEMQLLEDLKTGGFDIDRLQDEGILRFVSEREGAYRMPQNALLRLPPGKMDGTMIEFNGKCYKISKYSENFAGDPCVTVSRYEKKWHGRGEYQQKGVSIGPLLQRPKNGLELIALTLQQQEALLKTG
ncbi:hypothetical protein KY335_00385 [Candidatus Woesearchaeota archaeon]|nr:hypothetical protein [Candidatus Woesearchaeota archaeon]MBW3013679.1 hypothetical protein [Candidatus Woesearchaeota archaeon]